MSERYTVLAYDVCEEPAGAPPSRVVGRFDDAGQAMELAQHIVDRELAHVAPTCKTAAELIGQFRSFGEGAVIYGEPALHFNPYAYAAERAQHWIDQTRHEQPLRHGETHGMNDTTDLIRAAAFAAHKHRNQRRKDADASPYINHPLALARTLAVEGGITDAATLCAALLHDTIEDTDTTAVELLMEFGPEVAAIVVEVTDDKALLKAERKRAQVEHAEHISDKAKRVKLADKICNLRDVVQSPPAAWSLERRREYFDWAKSVIERLRGVDARLEDAFDEAYRARP